MNIEVKLWGVRGSIPCPGPQTVVFGGNTACLELRFGDRKRLVILDAGSGIRLLGNEMLRRDLPQGPIDTDLFVSHTHWDHIMGFPFFTPIFIPGTRLRIYGPVTYEEDSLDTIIGGQLSYRYFPVRHDELAADIKYTALKECTLDLPDGIQVTTKYLNHPVLTLGYKFSYKGSIFTTAYDTEPFRNVFPSDPAHPDYDEFAAREGEAAAREENEKLLNFYKGSDILLHDAQYTQKEYEASKLGWGHTSYESAINMAHKAGVKKLVLFHHDPVRGDEELSRLEEGYRAALRGKTEMEISMAREGMILEL